MARMRPQSASCYVLTCSTALVALLVQSGVASRELVQTTSTPMMKFDSGSNDHIMADSAGNEWSIVLDDIGTARARSARSFGPPFTISAMIKPPGGVAEGIVSSYYISSMEGARDQDEIDIEFLGRDLNFVQTNYFVNGVGGNELLIPLGFDASLQFHNYTLFYGVDRLIWYVDGRAVREVDRLTHPVFPVKPGYIYSSLWDASSVADGTWAGTSDGLANGPFKFQVASAVLKHGH